MDRRKEDNLSLPTAKLLVQSLNMKMENFLNSPIDKLKEDGMEEEKEECPFMI